MSSSSRRPTLDTPCGSLPTFRIGDSRDTILTYNIERLYLAVSAIMDSWHARGTIGIGHNAAPLVHAAKVTDCSWTCGTNGTATRPGHLPFWSTSRFHNGTLRSSPYSIMHLRQAGWRTQADSNLSYAGVRRTRLTPVSALRLQRVAKQPGYDFPLRV